MNLDTHMYVHARTHVYIHTYIHTLLPRRPTGLTPLFTTQMSFRVGFTKLFQSSHWVQNITVVPGPPHEVVLVTPTSTLELRVGQHLKKAFGFSLNDKNYIKKDSDAKGNLCRLRADDTKKMKAEAVDVRINGTVNAGSFVR